jgi:acyl transferase domain-containing protein
VPSMNAQIEMLQQACRRAGIDPSQVGYVEAHGTGTPVGDPIEAQASGQVVAIRPRYVPYRVD